MQENVGTLLVSWENFYVIMGSSAAALIGLMFVVSTLVAGIRMRPSSGGTETFSSPTVVHFSFALFIAAALSAPWGAITPLAILLDLIGLAGVGYVIIVLLRARRLTAYQLVLEDWLWHMVFPFIAYATLLVAALFLPGNAATVLFFIGAATVLLLFIGIHNAWDSVTYLVVEYMQPKKEAEPEKVVEPEKERQDA